LLENPEKILGSHVLPGMTVLEPGSAMGYFSLPLARMVGPLGMVICLDIEKRMLDRLRRRARRAGLSDRIKELLCTPDELGAGEWQGKIDFIPAIHVVHEVGDQGRFLEQLYSLLKPGGRLLLRELKGHVKDEQFRAEIKTAGEAGFRALPDNAPSRRAHSVLHPKQG